MYRSLRSALLGTTSWAVMVGREKMRMMERGWYPVSIAVRLSVREEDMGGIYG